MAITVSGKNYTQISSCDTGSSGGQWGLSPTEDSANKKEGVASICDCLKSAGDNNWVFTPTSSVDLSGTKHLRIWMILTHGGLINTYANGGIQIGITDGTNTGYWYVGGKDSYPGGWHNFVVDTSKVVDAGTKPTNMNAITAITIRVNLTGLGKNVDNIWVDNLCVCDGLITYGDNVGEYYDFEDIFSICDDPSIGGWGILTKKVGTYCLVGSLDIGDSASSSGTKFQAKSQVVVFENRPNKNDTLSNINANLMNITVVDNGTGTTEFILGEKSGTQGISGCTVRTQDPAQIAKFDIIATDTDISDFKLYGSTVLDAGSISLPTNGVNKEALNCNFEKCGQVAADTCVVKYCNFISADTAVDAAVLINDDPHYVTDCNFISCDKAIEIDTLGDGTYDFTNLKFSGSITADVNNTCGSSLTVNKLGTSDPTSYTGSTVVFAATVTLTVTVVDKNNDPIENAQTAIWKPTDFVTPLMNEDTLASGIATEDYSGSTPQDIIVRIRKSSTGATKYIPASTTGTIIANTGYSVKITLQEDTNT